jgi:hypothetical protein
MLILKPLKESKNVIPETFEKIISAKINDHKIQKRTGIWFTRNERAVFLDQETKALNLGEVRIKPLYKGSFEITLPKGICAQKNAIEITYRGRAWFSVKLIEATLTQNGVTTSFGGNWKKLDTVREKEILSISQNSWHTKPIYIEKMYNKPFNVSSKAFIRGFRKVKKENLASLEITLRLGRLEIKKVRFI